MQLIDAHKIYVQCLKTKQDSTRSDSETDQVKLNVKEAFAFVRIIASIYDLLCDKPS